MNDSIGVGRRRSPGRGESKESDASSTNELKNALLTVLAPVLTNAHAVAPVPVITNAPRETGESKAVTARANYWALMDEARRLVAREQWEAAKSPLKTLIALCPDQSGPNNAYAMLASVHRGLNETEQERAALEKWADADADALDAYQRLMQLGESNKEWKVVAHNADRFLAVNPLLPQPYRFLARASEESGEATQAINAYQKVLLLDPPDPADVHYRLARLLHKNNDPTAKRHVLQALEEAPRFRDAHILLLELALAKTESTNSTVPKVVAP
jgi:tetratricopeptide (TPR) repeat protein